MHLFKSLPTRHDFQRTVYVAPGQESSDNIIYPTNYIKTSKYSFISFLPLSLFGQFRRYANIYFLFIAILQSIPQLSPLNPFSAIAPLVFVVALSMSREGYEDYQRHKSDKQVNSINTQIYVDGKFQNTTWADLKVGDIVLLEQDQMIPADIIILGSESGVCYIETSSLDGEKNLKRRQALPETQEEFKEKKIQSNQNFVIEAQAPSQSLYEFNGSIKKNNNKQVSINAKQLLLRGAFIRNTDWVLGLIIYTGWDTKIMRNSDPARSKQSNIEFMMNRLILLILSVQFILCSLSAILLSWWMNNVGYKHSYLELRGQNYSLEAFLILFSYFLLYSPMIPISLVVSLEFVKVFQVYFIQKDKEMFANGRYVKANTSSINEELGQVEYIFTDKTGTLTSNKMELRFCMIGNFLYGQNIEVQNKNKSKVSDQNINIAAEAIPYKTTSTQDCVQPLTIPKQDTDQESRQKDNKQNQTFKFKDLQLTGVIDQDPLYQDHALYHINLELYSLDGEVSVKYECQRDLILEYLFILSSAHECLVSKNEKTGDFIYSGPSPDEITLVDAAYRLGFVFEGQKDQELQFTICGKPRLVEILNQFEFDSSRRRMSIIIRDGDTVKLFMKGADSVLKQRMKEGNQPFLKFIDQQVDETSKLGLRTLMIAMKIISNQEYEQFQSQYTDLINSNDKQDELIQLIDKIERDLYIIGATAVEDKLQDQVPDTIADLLKGNIKVWMLTGDKLETAENIARSCRLVQGDMTIMRFSGGNQNDLLHKIKENKMTYDLCLINQRKKCFIIEGDALQLIIENKNLAKQFVNMAQHCESVVCCRMTPKQKASVVRLIKKNLNKITMAIGDGANDVNMIQEAHIGIGIYGIEGMQAVQAADFAIGEFRCLWRLLFVHGHWSYIRISEMILYFYYKNMVFTVPQILFAFYCAYSAQTFYDDWYITFYNLFFTAIPLVIRASLDQDINYKITDLNNYQGEKLEFLTKNEIYLKSKFPLLYFVGQQNTIFTYQNFIFWWYQGIVHGVVVFYITLQCFNMEILSEDGQPTGLSALGVTVYTIIIILVDLKIALCTRFWTWFNVVGLVILSFGLYVAYFCISNFLKNTYSWDTTLFLLGTSEFYLIIIVVVAIAFVFDQISTQIVSQLRASPSQQMIKYQKYIKKILLREPQIIDKIRQVQMQKKENNSFKEWGDSFFEEIVNLRNQQEISENKIVFEEEPQAVQNQVQVIKIQSLDH